MTEFSAIEDQLQINIDKIEKLNMANAGVNQLLYRETLCSVNNIKASLAYLHANVEGLPNGTNAK